MGNLLVLDSESMYVNVEMDDGSVPMTTNPSYGRVELSSQQDKVHYANL